jgi:hypothetical protein
VETNFGRVLRKLLKEVSATQVDIAKDSGMNAYYISRLCTNRGNMPAKMELRTNLISSIANALDKIRRKKGLMESVISEDYIARVKKELSDAINHEALENQEEVLRHLAQILIGSEEAMPHLKRIIVNSKNESELLEKVAQLKKAWEGINSI